MADDTPPGSAAIESRADDRFCVCGAERGHYGSERCKPKPPLTDEPIKFVDANDPDEGVLAFLKAWGQYENAPRTTCPECAFESSEGYPPSHAPGCSYKEVDHAD